MTSTNVYLNVDAADITVTHFPDCNHPFSAVYITGKHGDSVQLFLPYGHLAEKVADALREATSGECALPCTAGPATSSSISAGSAQSSAAGVPETLYARTPAELVVAEGAGVHQPQVPVNVVCYRCGAEVSTGGLCNFCGVPKPCPNCGRTGGEPAQLRGGHWEGDETPNRCYVEDSDPACSFCVNEDGSTRMDTINVAVRVPQPLEEDACPF